MPNAQNWESDTCGYSYKFGLRAWFTLSVTETIT